MCLCTYCLQTRVGPEQFRIVKRCGPNQKNKKESSFFRNVRHEVRDKVGESSG